MERFIVHVDFDYFFAQLEEKRSPKYKDKPIVVCIYSGRNENSGAVATSNYKAREYGVKAGFPITFAKKKLANTDSLFLSADLEYYSQISDQIMALLEQNYVFEKSSIDEAYLDITKEVNTWKQAEELGKNLQNKIKSIFDLTCSIGVGPNKLIAKMASDYQKPNGLTVISSSSVNSFLYNLDIIKIPGIGKKTQEILNSHDVKTIGNLAQKSPVWLLEEFGKKTGTFLINASHGIDETPVVQKEVSQISRIKTLKENSLDLEYIFSESQELIGDIAARIDKTGLSFCTVAIIGIDENLKLSTKSKTLSHASSDVETLKKITFSLWKDFLENQTISFRRIGVKVEKLQLKQGQKNLMDF